jgi:hypothetical protein
MGSVMPDTLEESMADQPRTGSAAGMVAVADGSSPPLHRSLLRCRQILAVKTSPCRSTAAASRQAC